jgi:hypothetical protein
MPVGVGERGVYKMLGGWLGRKRIRYLIYLVLQSRFCKKLVIRALDGAVQVAR